MMEERLYTPEEISQKLKISKYTVYEMIKREDLPAFHIGRSIRISEGQLEEYMMKTKKMENIYNAEIISENGCKYGVINGVKICVSTNLTGAVKLSIRPEDIILSKGSFVSSARNIHKGVVLDIIYDDMSAKILFDIGIPMLILITKQSMLDMDIKKGDELFAVFKTMSVRVIKQ